ncbi:MAG: NUDIX hydrolase [Bacteroidetes bacterium]|nr:NUDIX hydrolase [Bacteroidota bacterium]
MTPITNLKSAAVEKRIHQSYFKIALSVDCVIFGYAEKELQVLVIKSDLKEFAGQWSLLGDLVRPEENIDKASYRVLEERTGLKNVYLEQVQAFGECKRHPSGRVVTIAYYSLLDISNHKLQLSDNDLCWRPVRSLRKMAFDHRQILDTCLQRLREQVFEKPLLFNLLPNKFALRNLQELYESVLGETLDRRNFRKKIAVKEWLQETGEMERSVLHRPGRLYTRQTSPKR